MSTTVRHNELVDFYFRLPIEDAKFVCEFPGYLRCSLECKNGIVTDEKIARISDYVGNAGMCQIYSSQEGYFAIFFTSDRSVISSSRGVYTHNNAFHSIRSDTSLFVFEEDYTRREEAMCYLSDVKYYCEQLREIIMLKKAVSILRGEDDAE